MIVQPVLIRIPFQPGLAGMQRVERQRQFARIALDHCAKRSGAPAGEWLQTNERVPIPRDGYFWSIAHKPRFAAAVISRGPVGIDIEAVTPRNSELSTAVASSDEWDLIQQKGSAKQSRDGGGADKKSVSINWRNFFEMWTAKEAMLKANGAGIGGLTSCRLLRVETEGRFVMTFENRTFTVEHFSYAGHIAACTCSESRLQWHVVEGTD